MTAATGAADEQAAGTGAGARGPALLSGFGLGAFLDGIVLHQVLQWHHLVVEYRSASDLEGLEQNTFWDGIFHLVTWVVVVVGLLWLAQRSADVRAAGLRRICGFLLVGWGAFHVVDQVLFHLLLRAHHIRMVENYHLYDWGYTAVGVLLILLGRALARADRAGQSAG